MQHADVFKRFMDPAKTHAKGARVFFEGNELYSFGHHFTLAVRTPDPKGWGAGIKHIINGDRYITGSGKASSSTSGHQGQAIRTLESNVQIPFSALSAARLIHSEGWRRTGSSDLRFRIVAYRQDTWKDVCSACGREVAYPKVEGRTDYGADPQHVADGSPICPKPEGAKYETRQVHTLGAVVLRSTENRRYYLSSTDTQATDPHRAYFLCRLPHPVKTVEAAFESLKPKQVVAAIAAGLEVKRQGDVFFIRSEKRTKELPGPSAKHYGLFGNPKAYDAAERPSHYVSEARVNGAVYARGVVYHEPPQRQADHKRLKLGDGWWLAVKNTAKGSWAAEGTVD